MSATTYKGIDYGFGRSNRDPKTGICCGVISQHSVSPDALGDLESDYGEPHCPKCGRDITDPADPSITDAEWNDGKDGACTTCQECFWSDVLYPDEPLGQYYDADGYSITDCLDSDFMIVNSPYYTHAQYCSPCVPGAGNLDTPLTVAKGPYYERRMKRALFPRVYCLGPEWFDEYNPMPYRCFRISDNSEVK